MKRYPTSLTIAGSDSGGGAGIQADLKTFSALGVYGMSVITAITSQNTVGVQAVFPVPANTVASQLEAVLSDIPVDAVKLGMLHNKDCVMAILHIIDKYKLKNIVLDPVMISTSGDRLIEDDCMEAIRNELFKKASIITPNLNEAEALVGFSVKTEKEMFKAGEALLKQGCHSVLMKGGHLADSRMTDILFNKNKSPMILEGNRISTPNTHGTGCTLSSAIASFLALGEELPQAVSMAKDYISKAIEEGSNVTLGHGHGPVNHLFSPRKLKASIELNK